MLMIKVLIQIFFLLLALFYFQVDCLSSHLCLSDQRDALLEFKNSLSLNDYCNQFGSPQTNSWNKTTDCCSWEGVSCNNLTGHVIAVDLNGGCLKGSLLENSSLFHLRQLQRLNLSDNDFNGSISSQLFKLVSLTHLDLSRSGFSGLIPHEISLLSNLVSLDLSSPSSLRFDAQGFDRLARNLTKLRNLVLEYTDMSGVSVTSFSSMSSSMERLSLGSCRLHGEFPSEIFSLPNLKHVDLAWNENLTGDLPKYLSPSIEYLNLYYCRFKGSIPSSLRNLTRITYLDFYHNDFHGQIPDVFENLNELTILDFGSCKLSGQVPWTTFNLTKLSQLSLSHNRLEGALPSHVTRSQFLEHLSLCNNSISGEVPAWLFSLPSLVTLDLSYNKLTGPIPQFRKPNNSLLVIDMSFNDIQGPIPSSVFDLLNLTTLRLSSNNLSGIIKPSMLSKLENLDDLQVSNNGLLSLSNGGNYSFPRLVRVLFSSCSVRKFPSFLRRSRVSILDLSKNKISGGISKWEAEGWEGLNMLNLSNNFLTGLEQIPGKYLQVLDLHSNLLQGPSLTTWLNLNLRSNPSSYMSVFLISENKLTGDIPSLICNWTSLVVLDLSKNSFNGTIPACLGNFSYGLQFINLQMNNFHGKIPDSFTANTLKNLLLNDNHLEGSLPRSLANCTSLEVLNLGKNKLNDTFPHWLSSLPKLQVLILRSNSFHGSISNSIASSNFSALQIIDCSRNELTGPLPASLFHNLRAMKDTPQEKLPGSYLYKVDGSYRYIYQYYQSPVNVTLKRLELAFLKTLDILTAMDFSNNLLTGQIPNELGELISLQVLNISRNNFTGLIPRSFGNMVALESLDLSLNKFSGEIPSEMTNLTFLSVLDLSRNELVGPIPKGNQFNTFDNVSYSGNSGLCGLPLSRQCGNIGETSPPMEDDDVSFGVFFWKIVMMGYGCGTVLGLSFGYIVFTTGKPWWIVKIVERDLQSRFTKWFNNRKGAVHSNLSSFS